MGRSLGPSIFPLITWRLSQKDNYVRGPWGGAKRNGGHNRRQDTASWTCTYCMTSGVRYAAFAQQPQGFFYILALREMDRLMSTDAGRAPCSMLSAPNVIHRSWQPEGRGLGYPRRLYHHQFRGGSMERVHIVDSSLLPNFSRWKRSRFVSATLHDVRTDRNMYYQRPSSIVGPTSRHDILGALHWNYIRAGAAL